MIATKIPDAAVKLRNIRSFVLREGRFTAAQAKAYAELWLRYGHDFIADTYLDPATLFAVRQPIRLEIGFGNGEALAYLAATHPQHNFIGVEVHRPGIGHLFLTLQRAELHNVRILRYDAVAIIQALPPACLEGVYIFFPDPWPKTRHHKRRLLQPEFAVAIARVLQPKGFLHLATDWENYAQWILSVLNNSEYFTNCAADNGYITRPQNRPLTHFEQRGQRLGHPVHDILFYRRADA